MGFARIIVPSTCLYGNKCECKRHWESAPTSVERLEYSQAAFFKGLLQPICSQLSWKLFRCFVGWIASVLRGVGEGEGRKLCKNVVALQLWRGCSCFLGPESGRVWEDKGRGVHWGVADWVAKGPLPRQALINKHFLRWLETTCLGFLTHKGRIAWNFHTWSLCVLTCKHSHSNALTLDAWNFLRVFLCKSGLVCWPEQLKATKATHKPFLMKDVVSEKHPFYFCFPKTCRAPVRRSDSKLQLPSHQEHLCWAAPHAQPRWRAPPLSACPARETWTAATQHPRPWLPTSLQYLSP